MEERSRAKLQGAAHAVNLGWAGVAEDYVLDHQSSRFGLSPRNDHLTAGAAAPLSVRSSVFSLQEEDVTRSDRRSARGRGRAAAAKVPGDTSSTSTHPSQLQSSSFAPLPTPTPISTVLAALSEKQYLEDWVNSFEDEQTTFDSLAEYCELKLHEAIHVSRQLGTPNTFRTAVASALLCKVCSRFGRYENILAMLKKEVFESVYKESETFFETGGEVGCYGCANDSGVACRPTFYRWRRGEHASAER